MAFWPADPEVTILGSWWIFRLNVKQWEHANKRSFDSPRRAAMFFFALHQHCLPHRRHLSQLPALLAQGSEILPSLGQMDPFVGEAKSKPGQRRQHKQDGKRWKTRTSVSGIISISPSHRSFRAFSCSPPASIGPISCLTRSWYAFAGISRRCWKRKIARCSKNELMRSQRLDVDVPVGC